MIRFFFCPSSSSPSSSPDPDPFPDVVVDGLRFFGTFLAAGKADASEGVWLAEEEGTGGREPLLFAGELDEDECVVGDWLYGDE